MIGRRRGAPEGQTDKSVPTFRVTVNSLDQSVCGTRPGGKGSVRGPEAGDAPGPSFPEGLLDELALGGRVYPPEGAFPRLLLRPRHFDEVTVQRQVVTDRVLQQRKKQKLTAEAHFGIVSRLTGGGGPRGQNSPASPCLRSCSTGSSL